MDSTLPSAEAIQEQTARLAVSNETELIPAEHLRLHALELLESNIDLTVDLSGLETLDIGTLQILLALEQEQERKNLRLTVTGASSTLLRWFEYSGAQDLFLTTIPMERTSSQWN